MSWGAVSAIGSIATAVIILITVVIGRRQLDQLRRATQLEGAMGIFAELDSDVIDEARRFAIHELPSRLQNAEFRRECELIGWADPKVHKELILLRFFERLGAYVEEGLIDGEIINKTAVGRVMGAWFLLRDVVTIHRRILGDFTWNRFERLYESAARYLRAQGSDPDRLMKIVVAAADITSDNYPPA